MELYLGRFSITANLLNRVVSPQIIKNVSVISALDFTVEKNTICFQATGKKIINFTLTGKLEIEKLIFEEKKHVIVMKTSVSFSPWYLNIVISNPMELVAGSLPGAAFYKDGIIVDLDKIPQFAALKYIEVAGKELLSVLNVKLFSESNQEIVVQVNIDPAKLHGN